jgi:transcription elongation factor GreA
MIVGPTEADVLQNKLSNESPLGSALVGKKKGDIVVLTTPKGKQEYIVEGIA